MLALETPFDNYTDVQTFHKRVVVAGVRPKVDPKWPQPISDMMSNCWSPKMSDRPSMEDVAQTLRQEMSVYTDEEVLEILDVSRKSAMSLHGAFGK
jgi:hypothetical protein